ncbi:hypothetical protein O3M35_012328 [Rhynocoris fuscipes]|uniref:Uncharacterized protein n=1 Tax=Rhynocoris fuscipes TaxID=488301 RepID=A0AAW1CTM4_9HEMI
MYISRSNSSISLLCLTIFSLLSVFCVNGDSGEGNLKVLYRSLEKCGRSTDIGTCIRLKAVTLLERALHIDTPLVLNDYLSLTPVRRSSDQSNNGVARSEQEIEASLPKSTEEKEQVLDEMIADKVTEYLQARSLQFKLPALPAESSRGKKKGQGGMLLMGALGMGAMMIQLAMGKIALLAGKALLVGKMALLLSAIIGLKKLVGGGGGGESHQVVYATESHGGGHGGGWGRSLNKFEQSNEKAHSLAYSAHSKNQL